MNKSTKEKSSFAQDTEDHNYDDVNIDNQSCKEWLWLENKIDPNVIENLPMSASTVTIVALSAHENKFPPEWYELNDEWGTFSSK